MSGPSFIRSAPDSIVGKNVAFDEVDRGGPDGIVHRQEVVLTGTGLAQVVNPTDTAPASDAMAIPVRVVGGGGGGGLGGPATIADGDDEALGATTDVAVDTDSDGTVSAKLRGLLKLLRAMFPATLGQKNKAGSLSVTLASDEDALPVSGTVAVSGTVPVSDGGGSLTVDGTVGVSGTVAVDGSGHTQPVSGTVAVSGTVPVSAAALPLPSGAATEATLAAESAKLPATLGQKAKAAAMAVTLASDEDSLALLGAVNETAPATDTASAGHNGRLQRVAQRLTSLIALIPASLGQKAKSASLAVVIASDQDLATKASQPTSVATTYDSTNVTNDPVVIALDGMAVVRVSAFEASGPNGSLYFEVSRDGVHYVPVFGVRSSDMTPIASHSMNVATVTEYVVPVSGATSFRVRMGSVITGAGTCLVGLAPSAAPLFTHLPMASGTPSSSDIGVVVRNIPSGTQAVSGSVAHLVATTATRSDVAGNASNVTLLASNASRRGAMFFNESTAVLYLKLGATATTSDYTVQLGPNEYYEVPVPVYTGRIDGIWSAANGNVRITELS